MLINDSAMAIFWRDFDKTFLLIKFSPYLHLESASINHPAKYTSLWYAIRAINVYTS